MSIHKVEEMVVMARLAEANKFKQLQLQLPPSGELLSLAGTQASGSVLQAPLFHAQGAAQASSYPCRHSQPCCQSSPIPMLDQSKSS